MHILYNIKPLISFKIEILQLLFSITGSQYLENNKKERFKVLIINK